MAFAIFTATTWAASVEPLNVTTYGDQVNIMQFFPPAPEWVDQVAITGGASTTYTIPTGAVYLILSTPSASDFYVRLDAPAVVPAAGIVDGTGSFCNPAQLNVRGVTAIRMI